MREKESEVSNLIQTSNRFKKSTCYHTYIDKVLTSTSKAVANV